MCGIVGFSGNKDYALLKIMNEALYHRGPDDDGYYSDGLINLGMRRLSIVDIQKGAQPISNEDNTIWIIFNGEIYNHVELKKDLLSKHHRFKTDHSDTEVIVHLYEEYGQKWPLYANGMFAVAIWDSKERKLSLYRDRIGQKPLYYALKGSQIIFGSEIKTMLKHPAISKNLDFLALYNYFGLKNISAPKTAYSDIKQLLPGHILVWRSENSSIASYWKPDFSFPLSNISEEEAAENLLELLEDAVSIRMKCDVSYGAYLSGGVDSSSVVMLMNKNGPRPIKTFSLGYRDKEGYQFGGKKDDNIYAKKIAQKLGTEHFEYIISAGDFAKSMPDALSAFDEPFSGTVSTFFLSTLIKDHVKVALSGDGADELFGSYLAHRLAFPIEAYLALLKQGKEKWKDLDNEDKERIYPFDNPEQFDFLRSVSTENLAEWRGKLYVFNHLERRQLLKKEFFHNCEFENTGDVYEDLVPTLTARDALNKNLEIDQNRLLPDQVLPFVDRLSMTHSVETRSPYLDYRIIEFANKLPGSYKIRNGVNKYIHKKAMEKLLSKEILQRPKEGFVQPIYSWMHNSLKKWIIEQLDLLPEDFFNIDYVNSLKKDFEFGNQKLNAKIWNLTCFSLWFKNNMP